HRQRIRCSLQVTPCLLQQLPSHRSRSTESTQTVRGSSHARLTDRLPKRVATLSPLVRRRWGRPPEPAPDKRGRECSWRSNSSRPSLVLRRAWCGLTASQGGG